MKSFVRLLMCAVFVFCWPLVKVIDWALRREGEEPLYVLRDELRGIWRPDAS